MFGIVLGGSNNIFSVECEDSIIRQCTIKGKKLEASKGYYNPLAPGDEVEIDGEETEPWIKAPCENGILSITALRFIKED